MELRGVERAVERRGLRGIIARYRDGLSGLARLAASAPCKRDRVDKAGVDGRKAGTAACCMQCSRLALRVKELVGEGALAGALTVRLCAFLSADCHPVLRAR